MKVILTMAISTNGMIAAENGNEDFLSNTNWQQLIKLASKIGCIIWGRKTYEAVTSWEGDYLNGLEEIKKIIISQSDIKLQNGFYLAHSPEEALELLIKEGYTQAIITGGATINSAFAEKGLIDEVILDVNPAVIGKGISVFKSADFSLNLSLIDVTKIDDEIVELHYKVKK